MAEYFPEALSDIPKILSRFLDIPSSYFTFPNIIFYFIIPYIAATYFWYVIFQYKIRIFRRNRGVNMGLAFFISFFNVAMAAAFPPAISVPFFVACALLLAGRWTGKRVLLSIVTFVFIWRIYPWIMNLII